MVERLDDAGFGNQIGEDFAGSAAVEICGSEQRGLDGLFASMTMRPFQAGVRQRRRKLCPVDGHEDDIGACRLSRLPALIDGPSCETSPLRKPGRDCSRSSPRCLRGAAFERTPSDLARSNDANGHLMPD